MAIIRQGSRRPPSTGNLTWTASSTAGNQFQMALFTLMNPSTVGQENFGQMADFDPHLQYMWPFITYQGTYAGPLDSATLTADTLFDTSQFLNTIPPTATLRWIWFRIPVVALSTLFTHRCRSRGCSDWSQSVCSASGDIGGNALSAVMPEGHSLYSAIRDHLEATAMHAKLTIVVGVSLATILISPHHAGAQLLSFTYGSTTVAPNGEVFGDQEGPGSGGQFAPAEGQDFMWGINNARGTPRPTRTRTTKSAAGAAVQSVIGNLGGGHFSTGNLTWEVTSAAGQQFNLAMQTLLNPSTEGQLNTGQMANFFPEAPYSWRIFAYQGAYSGPTDSATLTADTTFDTGQFQNQFNGIFTIALAQNPGGVGGEIDLVYTPVPEPGTLYLVAIGLFGVWR